MTDIDYQIGLMRIIYCNNRLHPWMRKNRIIPGYFMINI